MEKFGGVLLTVVGIVLAFLDIIVTGSPNGWFFCTGVLGLVFIILGVTLLSK